jgi:hypothetical protein
MYLVFMNSSPPKYSPKNTDARCAKRRIPARAETVPANLTLAKIPRRIAGRAFTVRTPRDASVKGKFQTDECAGARSA